MHPLLIGVVRALKGTLDNRRDTGEQRIVNPPCIGYRYLMTLIYLYRHLVNPSHFYIECQSPLTPLMCSFRGDDEIIGKTCFNIYERNEDRWWIFYHIWVDFQVMCKPS